MVKGETRKLLEELVSILRANQDIKFVTTNRLVPIATEQNSSAVYVSLEEIALSQARMDKTVAGYDRHLLVTLHCNFDASEDSLAVYDFADSIERSILDDSIIWEHLVNRDLVTIDFDSQSNAPRRTFSMLFDFYYRVKK